MTTIAKQLLDQVLALDEDERIEFADRISESLGAEKDPGYDAAWEDELKERIAQVERGEVKLIPWRDVIKNLDRDVPDVE